MKNTLCFLLSFFFAAVVFAQGWERYYGLPDITENATSLVQTPDGGFFAGITGTANSEGRVLKISSDGTEEWSILLNAFSNPFILESANGNYFISGTQNAMGESVNIEIDLQGNITWEQPAVGGSPSGWVALPDGFVNFLIFEPGEVVLNKVDLGGISIWSKLANITDFIPGSGITATADGGFALGGHNGEDAVVAKFNNDGELEWTAEGGSTEAEGGNGRITQTSDGGYVVVNDLSGPESLPSISKFTATGDLAWNSFYNPLNNNGAYIVRDVMEDAAGDIVMVGRYNNVIEWAFLLKFSGAGDFLFYRTYNGSFFEQVLTTQEGFYCAAGRSQLNIGLGDAYLILTDPQGNSFPNVAQGHVALDENLDCIFSPGDQPLAGWTVRAGGDVTYYDITDTDGSYAINLDTGNYTLEIFPPNDLWSPCINPIAINLAANDTLTHDFPVQVAIECPVMQVDIGTPFLRRCFENTLTVQYCNLGTVPAEDASVEVTLDSLLEFIGSTVTPSGQTGNTYTFELGNVDLNECGSFQITVLVSCDAELGEALCMEAHVFPDSICGVPFNWSGASMVARAKCEGDSTVILELENVGTVPTSQPLEYIVIEDQIIFLQGQQTFNPMQVETFQQPANGATWRIICEQEPNHPGNSLPTAFVEGCGENAPGSFSVGFVNEHPMADGDGFVDIDCEEIIGSYDPNDKKGYPVGYDNQHYIEPNTDLEYRIRFQNTGTDTAFTVVIRDTLSSLLDPTTIRPGASSHAYEFDLVGNGVAVFTFPNIMLPDSNVNEPLSHGFVNFKISQQRDLAPGAVILNDAAIYFDFNEPIITNETFHTIEEDFIIAAIDERVPGGVEVQVYPNPFSKSAIFKIKNTDNQSFILRLFDTTGRLARTEMFTGNQLVFQRRDLREGIWFFRIEAAGRTMASGKLIVAGY